MQLNAVHSQRYRYTAAGAPSAVAPPDAGALPAAPTGAPPAAPPAENYHWTTIVKVITARNEVGARLCFYMCLWFCPQLVAAAETRTVGKRVVCILLECFLVFTYKYTRSRLLRVRLLRAPGYNE